MTRGSIKQWWVELFGVKYADSATYKAVDEKLDQIYDAHEAELKAKDERIAELVAERDELEYKFAGYLDHTTNSRISKTYGELSDMIRVFDDGVIARIAELEAKQEAIKEYCRVEKILKKEDSEDWDKESSKWYLRGKACAFQDVLNKMEQEQ